MPLKLQSSCCLCSTAGTEVEVGADAFDFVPPVGWASVRVQMSEPVLPPKFSGMANAVEEMGNNPAYSVMSEQLLSLSQPFATALLVCPACQVEDPLWIEVRKRLKAATEKEEVAAKDKEKMFSMLRAVPRPVDIEGYDENEDEN